ncbi:MAG: biotin/lipoyl-containing protein [Blastocatellia bacterium]
MKLVFELDGEQIRAEFHTVNGTARLTVDGRAHEAEVREPEPGWFTIVLHNRIYRCTVERSPSGEREILINGRRISVSVHDPKRLRAGAKSGAGAGGRAALIAPMPGKIVRILLQPGDEVAANQGVLIVEAMKMQNEVQSPRDGKVAEIRVTEGQTVNAGETLAVIE